MIAKKWYISCDVIFIIFILYETIQGLSNKDRILHAASKITATVYVTITWISA